MSQPLSGPLQAGLRLLPRPLPAAPSARLAAGLPSREDDGLHTLHRRNPRGLGPASTPVARSSCAGRVRSARTWPHAILAQAYQHLWLVLYYDACGGSPGLAIPRAPGPRPPRCWQSRSRLALSIATLADEDTLSRGLRTPPLPAAHAPVGDCWQNSRCRHLLISEEQHISRDTLVSHPNDQDQRPAAGGSAAIASLRRHDAPTNTRAAA